jgi:NTP pyrophosphatase (non-canonical NTP hydrolase)
MKDYIEKAKRTESIVFNVEDKRLLHASTGLMTEVCELVEGFRDNKGRVNLIEETGDALWYMALAYNIMKVDFLEATLDPLTKYDHMTTSFILDALVVKAGEILDMHKKSIFYGRDLDKDAMLTVFRDVEVLLASFIVKNLKDQVSNVMRMNIEKLQKRYPKDFEDVIDRDEDHELNHIKG